MCKFGKKKKVCTVLWTKTIKCLKPHVGIYPFEDVVRDGTFFHLGRFLQKSYLGKPQKYFAFLQKVVQKLKSLLADPVFIFSVSYCCPYY